jgi:hypothetical protein
LVLVGTAGDDTAAVAAELPTEAPTLSGATDLPALGAVLARATGGA